MKSIFNAKTAIVACLAVTVISLSSFTKSSHSDLLGSSQQASVQLAQGPQSAAAGLPTTYIVPTVYVIPYTRLITATRYITQTDLQIATSTIIPSQPGAGVLSPAQQQQRKLSSLD